MNKYDWLELATRILGIWFVASGILAIVGFVDVRIALSQVTPSSGYSLLTSVSTSFLGTLMVLLAPGFVGWLAEKDARARSPRSAQSARSDSL